MTALDMEELKKKKKLVQETCLCEKEVLGVPVLHSQDLSHGNRAFDHNLRNVSCAPSLSFMTKSLYILHFPLQICIQDHYKLQRLFNRICEGLSGTLHTSCLKLYFSVYVTSCHYCLL